MKTAALITHSHPPAATEAVAVAVAAARAADWRLIADQDGVKGWVHSATLVGRRSFAVIGKDRVLRKSASDDAAPVAVLKVGVVGRIRACEAGQSWCEMQVGSYRGWLRRDEFFGAHAGEVVK